jgi:hypothetical protein
MHHYRLQNKLGYHKKNFSNTLAPTSLGACAASGPHCRGDALVAAARRCHCLSPVLDIHINHPCSSATLLLLWKSRFEIWSRTAGDTIGWSRHKSLEYPATELSWTAFKIQWSYHVEWPSAEICWNPRYLFVRSTSPNTFTVRLFRILIKQLWVRQRNNSSSPLPMLLPQHVSVIRPSSSGIQYYTVSGSLLDCNSS